MANRELTEVEKRFAKEWFDKSEIKYDVNFDDVDSLNIKFFRELIKETAYHEAGHFIARVFTGLELSHVKLISIIPDKENLGRMRGERAFAETCLNQMPPSVQRVQGIQLLLEIYAGYGSVMLNKSEYKSLVEYLWEEEEEAMDDDNEGFDINRAQEICEIMSRPYMPKERIHRLAQMWTMEMLRIPEVWNAVETVAEILISKGEITRENDEISNLIMTLNVTNIYRLAKWRRRIFGTR